MPAATGEIRSYLRQCLVFILRIVNMSVGLDGARCAVVEKTKLHVLDIFAAMISGYKRSG